MPVAIGALAASPDIYAAGMGCKVDDIGAAWMRAIANPIPPVEIVAAPCQDVVITGDDCGRRAAASPACRSRCQRRASIPRPI